MSDEFCAIPESEDGLSESMKHKLISIKFSLILSRENNFFHSQSATVKQFLQLV